MEAPRDMIPWEHRGKLGPARAFWETLRLSALEPRRFYGLVPREESAWGALAYGLAFDLVVALLTFGHHMLVGAADLGNTLAPLYPQLRQMFPNGPEMIERITASAAVASLVFTPLAYLFNLLVTVTLTWAGLKLAGGMTTSYGRLLRMFAYASWIQIFGILAVPGDILLGALSFLLILGFGAYYWMVIVRESQRIETSRAVIASLYSMMVAFLFSCVFGLPLLIALGWLVYTLLPPIPVVPPDLR